MTAGIISHADSTCAPHLFLARQFARLERLNYAVGGCLRSARASESGSCVGFSSIRHGEIHECLLKLWVDSPTFAPWAVELTRALQRVGFFSRKYSTITVKRDLLGQCVREGAHRSARVVEDDINEKSLEVTPPPVCQIRTDVFYIVPDTSTRFTRSCVVGAFLDCSRMPIEDAVLEHGPCTGRVTVAQNEFEK